MAASGNERVWIGGSAVGAVLLVAAAWLLVINPELSNSSSLNNQTSSAQVENNVMVAQIAKLSKENADLTELSTELRDARAGLPEDSGMADYTRQISKQASQSGVALAQFAVSKPKAVGLTGAATTTVGTPVGQLFSMQVTLDAVGSAADMETFLRQLQYVGPRQALITSVQLAPAAAAKTVSIDQLAAATISLTVFSAPQSAAAQAQLQQQLSKAGSN